MLQFSGLLCRTAVSRADKQQHLQVVKLLIALFIVTEHSRINVCRAVYKALVRWHSVQCMPKCESKMHVVFPAFRLFLFPLFFFFEAT